VCFLRIPASQTQAVQMIGRCLRPHRDKRIAHVALPLVCSGSGCDAEDAGARRRVLALMRVMAQTDPRFARAMRSRGGAYVSVTIEGAEAAPAACELLHEAVYSSMGDALCGAWEARFAEMVEYYEAHGRVPPQSAGSVGRWVHTQRVTRETMRAERKAKLEALPWWSWGADAESAWEARLAEMVEYYEAHGRVPPQSAGSAGRWVHTQRVTREAMSAERKAKLEALPWWSWGQRGQTASSRDRVDAESAWEASLTEVVAYYEEHGRVPPQSAGSVGRWAHKQRARRGTMRAERKAKLEELPWWWWNRRTGDPADSPDRLD
jgi:hypothetical protein